MLCNDYGEVRASGFLVWPRVPSGWVLPWIGDMGGMRTLTFPLVRGWKAYRSQDDDSWVR